MNRAYLKEIAAGLELAETESTEAFEVVEFERVRSTLYLAVCCEAIPRRLGKVAGAAELALDKRVARKVANTYRSLWMALERLGGEPAPGWTDRLGRLEIAAEAGAADRTAGATVRWAPWFSERARLLAERRRLAAGLALRWGVPRWGVQRVRLLDSEASNVERIAGEIVESARRRNGGST